MVKKAQNVPASMKTLYLHYLILKKKIHHHFGNSMHILLLYVFHISKYGDHLPSHYKRKASFSQ